MKKTNNNKVEEFIRVDHAGERGAIKIYEGQLLALNTLIKDENLKKTVEEMKIHEKEHCDYFESEIKKRNIKPTKLLPLWDLLCVGLGFGSTILGKKAAMLCTASVEEVIDKHYSDQIKEIEESKIEREFLFTLKKFHSDEVEHKTTAKDESGKNSVLINSFKEIVKMRFPINFKPIEIWKYFFSYPFIGIL